MVIGERGRGTSAGGVEVRKERISSLNWDNRRLRRCLALSSAIMSDLRRLKAEHRVLFGSYGTLLGHSGGTGYSPSGELRRNL